MILNPLSMVSRKTPRCGTSKRYESPVYWPENLCAALELDHRQQYRRGEVVMAFHRVCTKHNLFVGKSWDFVDANGNYVRNNRGYLIRGSPYSLNRHDGNDKTAAIYNALGVPVTELLSLTTLMCYATPCVVNEA